MLATIPSIGAFFRARPFVVPCILLLAPLASCQTTGHSAPAAIAGPTSLADGRYTLVVHGMSCPKCISNVEMQLTRIQGITHPTVDMKNGFVRIDVHSDNAPSKTVIANAIEDSGFTLVEIREGEH